MMDELREFLKSTVSDESVSEDIKQVIWRVLVVGWYKFARDAKTALDLVHLFVSNSKKAQNEIGADAEADDCDKKPSKVISFYEKLFSTAHKMKPIEIFYQRFYHYPQSFYFYEALQHTKVQAVKVNLVSKSLLDGVKLVMPASIKVSNSVDPWALAD